MRAFAAPLAAVAATEAAAFAAFASLQAERRRKGDDEDGMGSKPLEGFGICMIKGQWRKKECQEEEKKKSYDATTRHHQ